MTSIITLPQKVWLVIWHLTYPTVQWNYYNEFELNAYISKIDLVRGSSNISNNKLEK